MTHKDILRSKLKHRFAQTKQWLQNSGKAAECVRNVDAYRDADSVFVSGAVFLQQVRINCLLDGKNLIMPAPGLKDGFYIIRPYSVSLGKLQQAVSLRGLPSFGKRLTSESISKLTIGIILVDALAVDQEGTRLGSGNGFVDLSCALLEELGGLKNRPSIFAVINEEQLIEQSLPLDPWDIKMTGVITSTAVRIFGQKEQRSSQLIWEKLPLKRIRKIDPLWELYGKERDSLHDKKS